MLAVDPDAQVFICSLPPVIQFACIPNLEKNGFTFDMYFAF